MRLTRCFYSPGEAAWRISERVSLSYRHIPTDADNPIAGRQSSTVIDYFARSGAPCPPDANPAEHIVEVIQGTTGAKVDWVDIWNQSAERQRALEKLGVINNAALTQAEGEEEDTADFATSKWFQWKVVLHRQMIQLWRSPVRLP
jgi:hypothetical protein